MAEWKMIDSTQLVLGTRIRTHVLITPSQGAFDLREIVGYVHSFEEHAGERYVCLTIEELGDTLYPLSSLGTTWMVIPCPLCHDPRGSHHE